MRVALAVIVLVACSRDRSRPVPDKGSAAIARADAGVAVSLDSLFLSTLARVTKRSVANDEIRAGTHTIRLVTKVENDVAQSSQFAVGVAVDVVVDGRSVHKLRTGSVGLGRTRNEAFVTAANEWAVQFGVPIVGAYEGTPPSFEASGMKIYVGPIGFRGTAPSNVDLAKPAFMALAPAVSVIVAQDDGMHAITLNLFRSSNNVKAEVRFDGEPHSVLTTDANKAAWPEGNYMAKLFYVLMR